MVTWIYDETGTAGAILDEFCVRGIDGAPLAWVFGVSVFALKGEHIGWFEHGVLFDVDNNKLGFVAGAIGLGGAAPHLAEVPPIPRLAKRPNVPTLRARLARPAGGIWSGHRLADYLDRSELSELGAVPHTPAKQGTRMDTQH